MTEIKAEDGSTIVTDLPAEKVADLQPKAEPAAEPAQPAQPVKDAEPSQKSAEPAPAEPTPAEPAPQEPARDDKGQFKPKPKPIASLLQKKHDAEARAEAAEKRAQELETKIAELSKQPQTAATADDVKALAEELGADPTVLQKIVEFARKGMNPQLPKEVQDLLAERQASKEQQEQDKAFDNEYNRLAKSLPDEQVKDSKAKEMLKALAFSDNLAPDGEPFWKKSLPELFYGFVKPQIEPGKPSAEPTRGGTGPTTGVVDFQAILDRDDPKEIEAMDDKTFSAYSKWMNEKQGDTRITRAR